MTIEQLEELVLQTQNEIDAAVGAIIGKMRLPRSVSASEITIPLIDVTRHGDGEKQYVCLPSQIRLNLELDTTAHSLGGSRLSS